VYYAHQYRARPAWTLVQSDQALFCCLPYFDIFKHLTYHTLKYGSWNKTCFNRWDSSWFCIISISYFENFVYLYKWIYHCPYNGEIVEKNTWFKHSSTFFNRFLCVFQPFLCDFNHFYVFSILNSWRACRVGRGHDYAYTYGEITWHGQQNEPDSYKSTCKYNIIFTHMYGCVYTHMCIHTLYRFKYFLMCLFWNHVIWKK
jgi:hypothetical protein